MNSSKSEKLIPDSADPDEETKKYAGYPRIKHILVILLLYINNGAYNAVTSFSVVLILNEHGNVPMSALSVFYFLKFPLILKSFLGSLLDVFYIESFGKCKSAIVSTLFLTSLGFLVYAFWFLQWIESTNLPMLYSSLLILNFVNAYNDIGIDVYCLKILAPHDVSFGGTCQGIGVFAGILLGFTLFIDLTSKKFAQGIYGPERQEGIVSFFSFFIVSALINVLLGLFVFLKMPESIHGHQSQKGNQIEGEEPQDASQKPSIYEVLLSLKCFFVNPHLRITSFIIASYIWFNALWIYAGPIVIQNEGFPKEHIAIYDGLVVPLKTITFTIAAQLCQRFHCIYLTGFCLWGGLVQNLFGLATFYVLRASGGPCPLAYWLLGLSYLGSSVFHCHIVTMTAYGLRICTNAKNEGAFLGSYNSIFQGSRIFCSWFYVFILTFFKFESLLIGIDACFLGYMVLFYWAYRELKNLKPEDFNVKEKEKITEMKCV